MKKTYVKPNMNIERFSLLQNIASMCANVPGGGTETLGKPTWGSPTNCAWSLPNWSLFASGNTKCDIPLNVGDSFSTDNGELICYNSPSSGVVVFGS